MEDRITIRITKQLKKSLMGYCNTTGLGQSDALRHVMERGFEKLRPREFYSEGRRDLSRLFRPVIQEFEEQARRLFGITAKQIVDDLHIAMAGLRDDFTALTERQIHILERLDELEARLKTKSGIDPMLAVTISQIHGYAYAMVKNLKLYPDVEREAVTVARETGRRFGVEVLPARKPSE